MANNSRIVPVPDRCRSIHGVFCADPSPDDVDVEAPPSVLLRHFGAPEEAVVRLEARPHCRLVVSDAATSEAAEAAADARREALELARTTDGVVVDLAVPQIVQGQASAVDSGTGTQWVLMDLEGGTLRSRGLEAFGLPELRIDAADPATVHLVLAVGVGLAQRLVTEWPEHDPVGPASITLRDVALAYGDAEAAAAAPTTPAVDLLIDYTADPEPALVVTLESDPALLFPTP